MASTVEAAESQDLSDEQISQLLKDAEERLRQNALQSKSLERKSNLRDSTLVTSVPR